MYFVYLDCQGQVLNFVVRGFKDTHVKYLILLLLIFLSIILFCLGFFHTQVNMYVDLHEPGLFIAP